MNSAVFVPFLTFDAITSLNINTITCSHGVNSLRQTLAHMQHMLRVNIPSFSETTLDHQQIRHNEG